MKKKWNRFVHVQVYSQPIQVSRIGVLATDVPFDENVYKMNRLLTKKKSLIFYPNAHG